MSLRCLFSSTSPLAISLVVEMLKCKAMTLQPRTDDCFGTNLIHGALHTSVEYWSTVWVQSPLSVCNRCRVQACEGYRCFKGQDERSFTLSAAWESHCRSRVWHPLVSITILRIIVTQWIAADHTHKLNVCSFCSLNHLHIVGLFFMWQVCVFVSIWSIPSICVHFGCQWDLNIAQSCENIFIASGLD